MWYNRFKEGREDINNDARPDRSSTSIKDENIDWNSEENEDNRRITIREVGDDVDISFGLGLAIFADVLGMKRTAAKIVTKLLNFEQKQHRMDIA